MQILESFEDSRPTVEHWIRRSAVDTKKETIPPLDHEASAMKGSNYNM